MYEQGWAWSFLEPPRPKTLECLRQDPPPPFEVILVIFGDRALIFLFV